MYKNPTIFCDFLKKYGNFVRKVLYSVSKRTAEDGLKI